MGSASLLQEIGIGQHQVRILQHRVLTEFILGSAGISGPVCAAEVEQQVWPKRLGHAMRQPKRESGDHDAAGGLLTNTLEPMDQREQHQVSQHARGGAGGGQAERIPERDAWRQRIALVPRELGATGETGCEPPELGDAGEPLGEGVEIVDDEPAFGQALGDGLATLPGEMPLDVGQEKDRCRLSVGWRCCRHVRSYARGGQRSIPTRCLRTRQRNRGLPIRYLRQRRLGSMSSRPSHSSECWVIHSGARRREPET